MNLIDFKVTKIISEEKGLMYKLMNMSDTEANTQDDIVWKKYLFNNGIKQVIEIIDMGGKKIETVFINIDKGDKPYKVGDKGVH